MGRAFEFRKERKFKRWGHMARVFTKIGGVAKSRTRLSNFTTILTSSHASLFPLLFSH